MNWMNQSTVEGLSSLVVGGGSGIGASSARMLAANGARVLVADRDMENASHVAHGIQEAGGQAFACKLDIGIDADIQDAITQVKKQYGGLNILINTAAYVEAEALDIGADANFRKSFEVNVTGALALAQASLPLLKRSEHAAIVHTGSLAGIHGFPRGAGYGPSKAALITLTRQIGLEWAGYGIRANVVIPGSIETPMSSGHHSAQVRAIREATIPMGRLGQPEEVASLAVFLASPAAAYMTSDTYTVCGGFSESMFSATFGATGENNDPAPVPKLPPDNWMSDSTVAGLAALIVGGGSGIGEATARMLSANGCAVVVADRDEEGATRVAKQINHENGKAIAVTMDIANLDDVKSAVSQTVSAFGRLDLMVNLAAYVRPEPLESASLEEWRRGFDVNVHANLDLVVACLPHLRESPCASVVNVGSLGGIWGRPNGGAYGPSKAAIMTLSRQMALEWAADGIRINAVTPGTIDTPLARKTVPENVLRARASEIPMGRLGTCEEMANVIVYLLSPAASYITAQVFNCDGGHAQSIFHVPMGN